MNSTAILVIDMQNAFCSSEGSLSNDAATLERYDETSKHIRRVLAFARERECRVIYTRHCYRPGYPEIGAELRTFNPDVANRNGLVRGTWDAAIIDDLTPNPEDIVVEKSRFDSFIGTDLSLVLNALGITRVLLTGVSTNVCVESTARSAAQRGYKVIVVAEATSASSVELHEAALRSMAYGFAEILSWNQIRNIPF